MYSVLMIKNNSKNILFKNNIDLDIISEIFKEHMKWDNNLL